MSSTTAVHDPASPTPPDEVETDSSQSPGRFLIWAVGLSLTFLGLMRLGWVEKNLLLPFTLAQASMAEKLGWTPAENTIVDLSCSGSDVIAMCLGAIIAYPVSVRARILGCIGGLALIVTVNTARIGTLWHLWTEKEWFEVVHVYVWPAVLMVVVLVYLLGWIGFVRRDFHIEAHHAPRGELGPVQLTPRFLVLLGVCVAVFVALSPIHLNSEWVLEAARAVASAAVAIGNFMGVESIEFETAAGTAITMNGNSYLVTQDCIMTPLIPVGVAIVLSLRTSWARRGVWMVALIPIFLTMSITRLLVMTVPPSLMPAADIVSHSFLQFAVVVPVVILTAFWRHGEASTSWQRGVIALGAALIGLMVVGSVYTDAIHAAANVVRGPFTAADTTLFAGKDPQNALGMLPGYQLGLFAALWFAAFTGVGWGRFAVGCAILAVSAVGLFVFLSVLANTAEYFPNVRYVRAWAVGVPLLVAIAMDPANRQRLPWRSGAVA